MNKTKLMFPLAALLMMPAIVGCGNRGMYQGIFNNDQIVCAYGTQVIDLTLESHVKSKLLVKSNLTKEDFAMPEKFTNQKEIVKAYAYSKSSFILVLSDGTSGGIPMTQETDSFNITVKESAFTTPNLGGSITVSLFRNEIKYAGESSEAVDDTSYSGINKVEIIGANFVDEVTNRVISLTNGVPASTDQAYNLINVQNVKGNGEIGLFDTDEGFYIYLNVEFNLGADVSVLFETDSTDLGNYKCQYIPIGLGGPVNNYFG